MWARAARRVSDETSDIIDKGHLWLNAGQRSRCARDVEDGANAVQGSVDGEDQSYDLEWEDDVGKGVAREGAPPEEYGLVKIFKHSSVMWEGGVVVG